jgi:hypothetical protein
MDQTTEGPKALKLLLYSITESKYNILAFVTKANKSKEPHNNNTGSNIVHWLKLTMSQIEFHFMICD